MWRMSILGKVVEYVASDAIVDALDAPIKGLDKVSKKLKAKSENDKQRLFECAPGEKVLLINQKMYTWTDRFNIFDEYQNVKYSVKGDFTSIKHHLHIYDETGKEVAFVKEKLLSLRPSAVIEARPVDFVFEIAGKKAAKLRSTWSLTKSKYLMDNGWIIEGNIIGWKYKITYEGKLVATISKKLLYWGDTYLITYPEGENELLILMIVLALDTLTAPTKSKVIEDNIHVKTHWWL
jgi:uncharacterized protein YxjI